ncbi:MAG: hypothetical protein ABL918_12330 [Chakrabartia sp.]
MNRVLDKKSSNKDVFINCPFDAGFLDIFRAIIFAVRACGFRPRCAKDENDGAQVRIEKIYKLIEDCDWGIHDLSAVALDKNSGLPRFNMPLELGISLGAKRYGGARQKTKCILILDKESHSYDASTSDISGQDNETHGGDPHEAIKVVRNWLSSTSDANGQTLPGGQALVNDFKKVRAEINKLIKAHQLDPWPKMTHPDYLRCLDAALNKISTTSA